MYKFFITNLFLFLLLSLNVFSYNITNLDIPIGNYNKYLVNCPCGIVIKNKVLGIDNKQVFQNKKHYLAQLIWFSGYGYLNYQITNPLTNNQQIAKIRLFMEVCSEHRGYNLNWPSDLSIYINSNKLFTYTLKSDFGGKYARYPIPSNIWSKNYTQYGYPLEIEVNKTGTYLVTKIRSKIANNNISIKNFEDNKDDDDFDIDSDSDNQTITIGNNGITLNSDNQNIEITDAGIKVENKDYNQKITLNDTNKYTYKERLIKLSNTKITDLNLNTYPFIDLKLSIDKTAKNKRGLNLFSDLYGNYNKPLQITFYYYGKKLYNINTIKDIYKASLFYKNKWVILKGRIISINTNKNIITIRDNTATIKGRAIIINGDKEKSLKYGQYVIIKAKVKLNKYSKPYLSLN